MLINKVGTLKQNLEKENIPYVKRETISKDLIAKYVVEGTMGFSIATFWIFKKDVIELFDGGMFNYHAARLPKERGGGIITQKILSRSKMGGLTIHKIVPGIDQGDIVMAKEFLFPETSRIPLDYFNHMEKIEVELLSEFLDAIDKGDELRSIPQIETYSIYWPVINSILNGYINWDWSVDDIELFICAFDDPYEGASTFYRGRKVHLKKCFYSGDEGDFHPFQAGIVLRNHEGNILIAAEGGSLIVQEIFDENGNQINDSIRVGNRFYTPYDVLGKAKQEKVVYGPSGLATGH
ncbi:MAG: formyltransferase family protein [Candidatus Methanoperedens sp.]